MRKFPPRLPQQPFFYPVANVDYARQIARDWNTRDKNSGFSGFVTRFDVASGYLSNFEQHTVGSLQHVEYWIPAGKLISFNEAIQGLVHVGEAFFGTSFTGYTPDTHSLEGRDAIAQFVALSRTWEQNRADLAGEVSHNRKTIFLNWLYWLQHDFSDVGVTANTKNELLRTLRRCWELNVIQIPLPQNPNEALG